QMVQALSARVSEAPNLVGMSLGNEVNQFSASNHPDPDELTVEQAEDWTGAMFEAARLGAPAGMHTVANHDAAWVLADHVVTPGPVGARRRCHGGPPLDLRRHRTAVRGPLLRGRAPRRVLPGTRPWLLPHRGPSAVAAGGGGSAQHPRRERCALVPAPDRGDGA